MPVIDLAFALGGSPTGARQGYPLRLKQDLRSLQVKLRIDQAGAEALLARRKNPEGAATDQSRKEIAQIEDQLAVLSAQRKAVESGGDARSD